LNSSFEYPSCKDCGGSCCKLFVFSGPRLTEDEWESLEKDIESKCSSPAEFEKFRNLKALPVSGGQIPYACAFLSPEGLCTIYDKRPRVCRAYPVVFFKSIDRIHVKISEDCFGWEEAKNKVTQNPSVCLPIDPHDTRAIDVQTSSFYDDSMARLD
jgi:Fe-S-cluster containining protein